MASGSVSGSRNKEADALSGYVDEKAGLASPAYPLSSTSPAPRRNLPAYLPGCTGSPFGTVTTATASELTWPFLASRLGRWASAGGFHTGLRWDFLFVFKPQRADRAEDVAAEQLL